MIDEDVIATTDAEMRAHAAGYAEAIADVVAWLRDEANLSEALLMHPTERALADKIERGGAKGAKTKTPASVAPSRRGRRRCGHCGRTTTRLAM